MKKNLATEAGPINNDKVDAINQVFAIFRRNYHNQYFKAFPDEKELNITKRLWLDSLKRFSPEVILQATKNIIESREFLPTLHSMLSACEKISLQALPDAHNAYLEACRAPSPKANAKWSHLAVYYAGRASDWYFLQNNPESIAFPVFKEKYQEICQRVNLGEKLERPQPEALPDNSYQAVDRKTNIEKLQSLRDALDLN